MSDDNIFDISGTVTNSSVTVNQNQGGNQSITAPHIEYVIDDATIHDFPSDWHDKKNAFFLGTAAITVLGSLADILGVLSYFGIEKGMAMFVLVPFSLIVMFITQNDRWLAALKADGTAQFKNGLWYERRPDGNFQSYTKKAKCLYPKCNGFVYLVTAPPREEPNHKVIGVCSVGGLRHTYSRDFNGIGYPQEFDWRPIEQEKRTHN